jgi:eukaryotic-like serine/threonine-protein kinase
MEADNVTNDPQGKSQPDSDATLSVGWPGGPAAGQIGPYRLLRLLGEGGMGEVWLAEQKTPIHRNVALKLIKVGMDTKAVVARFESERQALALMDHPNIAQVYDGGATPEGRPYFVMEHVPGLSITEYCDKHRLTMRERLELFKQVCDGVQHAHLKAIIHRDLKPSNVLVAEVNGKPLPKIIDFGLVKAMGQRLTDKTMFTELGVPIGTPEYMSPEQADLREQNIDTRTDVYSLGVILYELLVGGRPFEVKALRAAGLEAILRIIREEDPPKPSTKVRSMGDASTTTAENRREEPRSFARHLQGELDWITMKALDKDRSRRYSTAAEFAADVDRYLRHEAVVAGPATTGYRIRKYAARHGLALGTAAVFLLLLAGFTVAQAVEIHRVRIERDRANRERDRANRVSDFMVGIFQTSDPSEAKGNKVTAREVLDKASAQIDASLANDPDLRSQMMHLMAFVYYNLGIYSRAQSLAEKSFDIRRQTFGPGDARTIDSAITLADAVDSQGHYSDAEKLDRDTLAIAQRSLGPDHQDTLTLMSNLAVLYNLEGRFAEAEKLNRETLVVRQRVFGPEHHDTIQTMINIASNVDDEGRFHEAEEMDRKTLEISRRVLGDSDPNTLLLMNNLANTLGQQGRPVEAEKLMRETIDIEKRVLGPEHQETLRSMGNLADELEEEHRFADAEKLDRHVIDIQARVMGPDHPETLRCESDLAEVIFQEGRYSDAEKFGRQIYDADRRALAPDNRETLRIMGILASTFEHERKFADAEKLDRALVDAERRVAGPNDSETLRFASNLGLVFLEEGRYADAEKEYSQLYDASRKALGEDNPATTLSAYNLACAVTHQGRKSEALDLLQAAVDHGLQQDAALGMDKDPDLKALQGDPRFEAIVARAKGRAAAVEKPQP